MAPNSEFIPHVERLDIDGIKVAENGTGIQATDPTDGTSHYLSREQVALIIAFSNAYARAAGWPEGKSLPAGYDILAELIYNTPAFSGMLVVRRPDENFLYSDDPANGSLTVDHICGPLIVKAPGKRSAPVDFDDDDSIEGIALQLFKDDYKRRRRNAHFASHSRSTRYNSETFSKSRGKQRFTKPPAPPSGRRSPSPPDDPSPAPRASTSSSTTPPSNSLPGPGPGSPDVSTTPDHPLNLVQLWNRQDRNVAAANAHPSGSGTGTAAATSTGVPAASAGSPSVASGSNNSAAGGSSQAVTPTNGELDNAFGAMDIDGINQWESVG
ncbi:hypothetical protein C8J56DRAFT_879927 [Mycena floridula]|nr:hypothetical protein C8J56DRAFT_902224 [Mycena floridula]KAJ7600197.1 hypothetical protein C8J56DRAFT_879927 [Mycena floridula]